MSTLDRYKKTGGFVQLLSLLETSAPSKREKFFELIRSESPQWADTLKMKMLDLPRIYTWSDDTLAEIVGTLQDLTLAVAIHAAEDPMKARLLSLLTHSRRRKVEDLVQTQNPSSNEVATTHAKIVETVRKMSNDGHIRFEKFDPDLAIEEDIEDKIGRGAIGNHGPSVHTIHSVPVHDTHAIESTHEPHSDTGDRVVEIQALRKKLAEVSKENAVLRHELSLAKNKLEQIKKIA